jgi:hypothetical protein
MRTIHYFKEQGVEGFTSITDKNRLSEAIYYAYRLFMIKEASDSVDDLFGRRRLKESDKNLEGKFRIGSWLYHNGNLFIKSCPLGTRPKDWPRHIIILEEHTDEIGVPVTDNNRLEINRAFKRGFNYFDDENNAYTIMAGESFTEKNMEEVLDAFNVPEDTDYVVRKTPALDPADIDPQYFKG